MIFLKLIGLILLFNTAHGFFIGNRNISSVRIILYYGPGNSQTVSFSLDNTAAILTNPNFFANRFTTLYIHGYKEDQTFGSTPDLVSAYSRRNNQNFLTLDWAELSRGNYILDAVINSQFLGPILANNLIDLFNRGLNLNAFHLVGHSLGAQLAGLIGRSIISVSQGAIVLPRITGLDPANPGFYIVRVQPPLNATDARFVDIIHSDAWLYGAPFGIGTADFWPNGGTTLQPGCPRRNFEILTENDLCSHWRSWRFWAESVSNRFTDRFIAYQATSFLQFKFEVGNGVLPTTIMGIDASTNIRGDFYLLTNRDEPFARGQEFRQFF